jgi:hypothetical protein
MMSVCSVGLLIVNNRKSHAVHFSDYSTASTPAVVRKFTNEDSLMMTANDQIDLVEKPTSLAVNQSFANVSTIDDGKKRSRMESLDELSSMLIQQNLPVGTQLASHCERYVYGLF